MRANPYGRLISLNENKQCMYANLAIRANKLEWGITKLKEDIGKILVKLPRTTKIPLHGNGMAAISKISREIQTKSFAKFYKT